MRALLATALALGFCPKQARAEATGGLELTWDAPPGCPSRDAVRARTRALVGASADKASRLRAQGQIVRSSNGRYRLVLKVREAGAETERVIESDSCADLAGAAAVALGLLMRVELESQGTSSAGKPAGETPRSGEQPNHPGSTNTTSSQASASDAKPSPDADADADNVDVNLPPPAPPSGSTSRAEFVLRAPLVGIDIGALPKASPNFGFAAGTRLGTFELTVGARLSLPQTAWSADGLGYGADLKRVSAELRGCYAVRSSRVRVGPCLLVAVDRITAEGRGFLVVPNVRSAFVFGAGAGAIASVELSRTLAFVLSIGAQVQTSRPRLIVEGASEVAQLAPFSLSGSTGFEWVL